MTRSIRLGVAMLSVVAAAGCAGTPSSAPLAPLAAVPASSVAQTPVVPAPSAPATPDSSTPERSTAPSIPMSSIPDDSPYQAAPVTTGGPCAPTAPPQRLRRLAEEVTVYACLSGVPPVQVLLTPDEEAAVLTALKLYSSASRTSGPALSASCSMPPDYGFEFIASKATGEIFPVDPPVEGLQCPRVDSAVAALEYDITQRVSGGG